MGSKAQCTATFDGQLHAAEVLDVRTAGSGSGQKQYYVHFIGLDKRLDEWVAADKLLPASTHGPLARLESAPSLALPPELLNQAETAGQKITRRLKRRLEDSHAVPALDDHAADHHAPKTGPEKEHAERNKVKNVQVRCVLLLVVVVLWACSLLQQLCCMAALPAASHDLCRGCMVSSRARLPLDKPVHTANSRPTAIAAASNRTQCFSHCQQSLVGNFRRPSAKAASQQREGGVESGSLQPLASGSTHTRL